MHLPCSGHVLSKTLEQAPNTHHCVDQFATLTTRSTSQSPRVFTKPKMALKRGIQSLGPRLLLSAERACTPICTATLSQNPFAGNTDDRPAAAGNSLPSFYRGTCVTLVCLTVATCPRISAASNVCLDAGAELSSAGPLQALQAPQLLHPPLQACHQHCTP